MGHLRPLSPLSVDDTIHEIASRIFFPKHLLSLALVSRACADIVLHDHLRYRVICADDVVVTSWNYILARPSPARLLWRMDITIHALQAFIDPDLVSILQTLPCLTSLSISTLSYSLSSSQFRSLRQDLILCRHLQSLTLIQFVLNDTDCAALSQLANLSTLKLHVKVINHESSIVAFIFKHHTLQVLDLYISVVSHLKINMADRFRTAHFPRLHTFALRSPVSCSNFDDLPVFLERHVNIREVTFFNNACIRLPDGSLPILEQLSSSPEFFLAVMSSPVVPPRPIHTILYLDSLSLYGPRFSTDFYLPSRVLRLTHVCAKYVPHLHLVPLAFPNLTFLHIDQWSLVHALGGSVSRMSPEDWYEFLATFPALLHFRGFPIFRYMLTQLDVDVNSNALRLISRSLPCLRTVDAWAHAHLDFPNLKRVCVYLSNDGITTSAALTRDSVSCEFKYPMHVFLSIPSLSDG